MPSLCAGLLGHGSSVCTLLGGSRFDPPGSAMELGTILVYIAFVLRMRRYGPLVRFYVVSLSGPSVEVTYPVQGVNV